MYSIKNLIFEKNWKKLKKIIRIPKRVQEVLYNQLAQQDREWLMTLHTQVGCSTRDSNFLIGTSGRQVHGPSITDQNWRIIGTGKDISPSPGSPYFEQRNRVNTLKGSTLVSRNSQQRCASASLCRSKRSSANSFDMYRPSTANVLTRYRPSQARINGKIDVSQ